ncbi:MAG: MFS transporter [Thermoanaerobaculia bacterium]
MAEPRRRFLQLDPVILALGFVSLFNDIASEMIYPLLPAFLAVTLGAGPAAVGVVEGFAEATASLGKGLFGWLSDRKTRRKPFVEAGYAASVFARPLLSLAPGWGAVLGIRFLDRIGKGIRTAPRDSMIAAAAEPARRGIAYGFDRAMDNAGAMIGPLIAALLLKLAFTGVRPVFALSLVPGVIALLLLRFGAREKASPVAPKERRLEIRRGAFSGRFLFLVGIFAVFGLASSTDAFLLLRAQQCGIPLWEVPLLWAAFNGVKAAASTPLGSLADRIGRIPSILLGWGVYAGSYFGFALARTPSAAWTLFLTYALFYALTEGPERALVAGMSEEGGRGRAFGLFHMTQGIAALPASVIFGLLWKSFGPRVAFEAGAAVAAAAALLLVVFAMGHSREGK